MERIKGANGELMKYSMQPMDGNGHLTLYRYDQLAVGGADNAHLEFWIEIEELRKQLADAQATLAALQARVQELEAQHEDLVERNRILRHRPDLPIERTEFHDKFVELQAQLTQRTAEYQKLVEWYDKQHGTPCELVRHRLEMEEVEADLAQRTAECDALKLVNDTHMKTVMKLSHVVEQRTAELEAANGSIEAARRVNNDLQAKLERVRADNKALDKWRADVTVALQRPEGAFFVDVPQHIKDLVAELERVKQALCDADERANEYQKALHDFESERALPLSIELERVRALIKALPKVEGEITCSQQFDSAWRMQYWQVEAYGVADECVYRLSNLREEEAKAYAALLQHRQGMEG